jgi:hypothetical protein
VAVLAEFFGRLDPTDRTPLLTAVGVGVCIAAALAIFPPLYVAAGFGAVLLVALAFFNRLAILYLLLPAVALSPQGSALGIPIRLEDVLLIPLVAGWVFHVCVTKTRHKTSLDRVLIAYLLVAFVATAWGAYLGTVHLLTTDKDTSATFHLLKRTEFVLLFLIMVDTLTTPRDVYRMTYVLLASFVGLAGFGLVQYLSNGLIAAGPLGSPSHETGLGSMLTVALGLTLFPATRGPARALLGAAILFALVTLPFTLGRNYVTTTLLILLYVGFFQQRWILVLVPAALLIGLPFYPAHVIERILSLQGALAVDPNAAFTDSASLLARTAPPRYYGLLALGHSPILGFGLASIPLGFADSEFVTQLFYTGLVGLAIFLVMGAGLFRMAREVVARAKDPLSVGLARGSQLTFVAYVIHSIFSPSISADRGGWFFFFAAALLAVLHRSLRAGGSGAPAGETEGSS